LTFLQHHKLLLQFFQIQFGNLQVADIVERRIEHALLILDHDQIIDVDDIGLMNLNERGRTCLYLIRRYIFPDCNGIRRVVQVRLPLLPV